jgi:hypothetical protein
MASRGDRLTWIERNEVKKRPHRHIKGEGDVARFVRINIS